MKKYKHKKTGLIITEENLTKERSNLYSRFYLANESDFEEIKEYPKIVSFKHKTKTKNPILNIKEFKGEESEYVLFEGYSVFDTKDYVVSNYDIYQVAISEDVVLTVGDRVEWNWVKCDSKFFTIKKFWLENNDIIVCFNEISHEYYIENIHPKGLRKAKTPVFTTIDVVDIYESDEYWIATPGGIVKNKVIGDFIYPDGNKRFSTREAASSYIYDNEPVFSRSQINEALNSIINSSFGDVLVDRMKTKLGL